MNAAQKSGKGAPAYSLYVNRWLGRRFAVLAYLAGLRPNHVTAISAAFSFAAIAVLVLVPVGWLTGVVVSACLVLGYALDAADGQLARLRRQSSVSGEWLDHMVDCVKISSLHLAVAVSLYRFTDLPDAVLLLPLGYAVVGAVSFFGQILNEQLRRNVGGEARVLGPDSRRPSLVRALAKIPLDYGVLCLVFLLLGSPVAFLVGYGVMFAAASGYLLLACVAWYRTMRGLDRRLVP
ncbi:CDP-alcohol phosphatidyltransferase family protein [Aquipuribacter nitratireducens]|uniref:CDP-alcohol phosphatidyltransferase family protein n=1 Tax=Aquipuribacter nitratireducens TaxID=650104 RepID=A0ABW0GQH7_9MICO